MQAVIWKLTTYSLQYQSWIRGWPDYRWKFGPPQIAIQSVDLLVLSQEQKIKNGYIVACGFGVRNE